MRAWMLALSLTPFFACNGPPVSLVDTDWTPPDQAAVDATYTTCTETDTCVVVELGCCDHCNGGGAIAVTEGQESAAMDAYGQTCGGTYACTEMGCAPYTAECQEGSCVLVEGEL